MHRGCERAWITKVTGHRLDRRRKGRRWLARPREGTHRRPLFPELIENSGTDLASASDYKIITRPISRRSFRGPNAGPPYLDRCTWGGASSRSSRSKLRLEERGRSVERCIPLIQHRRKALEHVRDAWGDLECDRHLGYGRTELGERAREAISRLKPQAAAFEWVAGRDRMMYRDG